MRRPLPLQAVYTKKVMAGIETLNLLVARSQLSIAVLLPFCKPLFFSLFCSRPYASAGSSRSQSEHCICDCRCLTNPSRLRGIFFSGYLFLGTYYEGWEMLSGQNPTLQKLTSEECKPVVATTRHPFQSPHHLLSLISITLPRDADCECHHLAVTMAWQTVGGSTCSAVQTLCAFTFLAQVVPVTYSIANVMKRVFVIWLSIVWFHQSVSHLNLIGMLTCLGGMIYYNKVSAATVRSSVELSAAFYSIFALLAAVSR